MSLLQFTMLFLIGCPRRFVFLPAPLNAGLTYHQNAQLGHILDNRIRCRIYMLYSYHRALFIKLRPFCRAGINAYLDLPKSIPSECYTFFLFSCSWLRHSSTPSRHKERESTECWNGRARNFRKWNNQTGILLCALNLYQYHLH